MYSFSIYSVETYWFFVFKAFALVVRISNRKMQTMKMEWEVYPDNCFNSYGYLRTFLFTNRPTCLQLFCFG